MITILELLHFKARGGVVEYKHSHGKENMQCTKLQNWLDIHTRRNMNVE